MFAPNGYCLIEQLENSTRNVLRQTMQGPDFSIIKPDDKSYSIKRLNLLAQFETALIREVREKTLNLLEGFDNLSLCSPDGLVLKISKSVLTPKSEFAKSKLLAYAGDEHLRPVLLNASWVIKTGRHFEDLNPDRLMKSIAQRNLLEGKPIPDRPLYRFSEHFRNFVGWSLVFREDDFPSNSQLRQACVPEETGNHIGRPEKQTRTLQAYDQIFPQGRNGQPWKMVAEAVSNAIEEPVSISTIRRAIKSRSECGQN